MKKNKNIALPLLCCYLVLSGASATLAENSRSDSNSKGLDVAKLQKAQNTGWQDAISELKMVLHNKSGSTNERIIEVKSLEVDGDGDKNLMVFKKPLDVQGTAFLSYSHIEGPDDQWIYLPALKRVKRISSRTKSGSFMGSDFSYEDLASFEVEKYDYNYLREEACGEWRCHVIENNPKDLYSGYSKLVTWVDTEHYRIQKVEFFDKRGQQLKTLAVKNYELLNEKFWRPTHSVMKNLQTGSKTELFWGNIRIQTGLTEAQFSQNSLKNAD